MGDCGSVAERDRLGQATLHDGPSIEIAGAQTGQEIRPRISAEL
jgi:hypothetical protein